MSFLRLINNGGGSMPIKLIRIDDRYIHGQVTVGWMNAIGLDEIWIIDDPLAKNEFLKRIQLAMAPPGKKTEIMTIDEGIKRLKSNDYDKSKNIMIISANAKTCRRVLEETRISDVDWINVGQSGWKHGKIVVTKNFAVSEEDAENFKKLYELGYKLIYKMLPDDKPQDFYELLKKKGLLG